jgi:hypothetical protein
MPATPELIVVWGIREPVLFPHSDQLTVGKLNAFDLVRSIVLNQLLKICEAIRRSINSDIRDIQQLKGATLKEVRMCGSQVTKSFGIAV